MAENSLIINATSQGGDKSQRTVTFTSDTAKRENMLVFAQGINALTTNNFVEAKSIQKVDLDEDPDGGFKPGAGYEVLGYPEETVEPDAAKTTPTITLTPATISKTSLAEFLVNNYFYDVSITYNGDGILYCDHIPTEGGKKRSSQFYLGNIIDDNGTKKLRICADEERRSNPPTSIALITIRSTTTATCNQASATFTITNN